MADFNKVNVDRSLVSAGAMGNASVKTVDIASLGVLAFGATTVFYATKIPKGSIINGVKLNAEAGTSAATGTLDVGYSMGATDDPDYFVASHDSVTGGEAVSAAFPLVCDEDCYIIITPLVADTVADKRVSIVVDYEFKGEV